MTFFRTTIKYDLVNMTTITEFCGGVQHYLMAQIKAATQQREIKYIPAFSGAKNDSDLRGDTDV
jgi:hypothetical protein